MANPRFPYIVSGTFYESDSSTAIADATVYLRNETTDEQLIGTTDSNGRYSFNLANLTSGYSNADTITLKSQRLFTRCVISNLSMPSTKEFRFTIQLELEDQTDGDALLTTAGLNETRTWLGGSSATPPKEIAWGTGTTMVDASDTTLEGEEERNAFGTQGRLNRKAWYIGVLATGEANSKDITKSGMFNASSSGTLFGEMLYGEINKTSTFDVKETNSITVE